jgi:hypothetical protein
MTDNDTPRKRHVSEGHIEFDAITDEDFKQLVQQTLETSDFISTHWQETESLVTDNVLEIRRIVYGDDVVVPDDLPVGDDDE